MELSKVNSHGDRNHADKVGLTKESEQDFGDFSEFIFEYHFLIVKSSVKKKRKKKYYGRTSFSKLIVTFTKISLSEKSFLFYSQFEVSGIENQHSF